MVYLALTAILALLWLAWMAFTWWALLFENRRPLTLTRLADDDPRTRSPYVQLFGHQAELAGFERIGTFVDGDPPWRQGIITMLLRPDGITLLRIHHSALVKRIVLTSATTSDTWILTASAIADPDSSGLSIEQVVFTSKELDPILAHHEARIRGREHELIPWSPDELIQDLVERDARKVQMLLQTGKARLRDQLTGAWSFTLAGARAQRTLAQQFLKDMMEQAKRK